MARIHADAGTEQRNVVSMRKQTLALLKFKKTKGLCALYARVKRNKDKNPKRKNNKYIHSKERLDLKHVEFCIIASLNETSV